ncbi:hypothetical protein HAT91_03326 [Dickeya solani]|nr:hypothetical protein HAT91_03326 [Dickeya solani]
MIARLLSLLSLRGPVMSLSGLEAVAALKKLLILPWLFLLAVLMAGCAQDNDNTPAERRGQR